MAGQRRNLRSRREADRAGLAERREYPGRLGGRCRASDGGVVHLRPIRPDDRTRSPPSTATLRPHPLPALLRAVPDGSRRGTCTASPTSTTATGWRWWRCSARDHRRSAGTTGSAHGTPRTPRWPSSSRTPTRAGASVRCCWSISPRRPGNAGSAVRRRGAGRELADGPGLPRRRLLGQVEYDSGVVHLTFPIAPTERSRAVRSSGSAAPRPGPSSGCSPRGSVAVIGASTDPRQVGHVVFANLMRTGSPGRCTRCIPTRGTSAACGRTRRVLDIPDEVDLAVVAVPAGRCGGVVEQCGQKGVRGAGRDVRRLRRAGSRRRTGAGGARSWSGRSSPSPARTACGSSARTASASSTPTRRCASTRRSRRRRRAAAGSASSASPARSASRSSRRRSGGGSACRRSSSAGNRADVSGNDLLQYWERRPGDRGRPALPGELRQPAQVRPAGPPGGPHQAGRGGEDGPVRGGGAGAGGPGGAAAGGAGAGALREVRRDPGGHR